MASSNRQMGLNGMVTGKSSHRQFMVAQRMTNHVKKISVVKSRIDMSVPKTMVVKAALQQRRPVSAPVQKNDMLTTAGNDDMYLDYTHTNLQLPAHDMGDTQSVTSNFSELPTSDILDCHTHRFTESRPFTPRTLKRPGAQSRLRTSGAYRPLSKKATKRSPQHSAGANNTKTSADLKSTRLNTTSYSPDRQLGTYSHSKSSGGRTDDFTTTKSNNHAHSSTNSTNNFFDNIDPDYMEFAEGLIRDISTSNVVSDEGINLIMEKNICNKKHELDEQQMRSICDLYRKQLNISSSSQQHWTSDYSETKPRSRQTALDTVKSKPVVDSSYRQEDQLLKQPPKSHHVVDGADADTTEGDPLASTGVSMSTLEVTEPEHEAPATDVTLQSHSPTASVTSLDDESVASFNMTLKPGEFSNMQQTRAMKKDRTVRFEAADE